MDNVERLATYIRSLSDFVIAPSVDNWEDHIGAVLADALLQAGINYDTVVLPRVERIFRKYPDAKTTSAFARLIEANGLSRLLEWKGGWKLRALQELIDLLIKNGVETTAQLGAWLENPANLARLKRISGIKDKTADYLQILVGSQSVAVDRHLFRFLADAGIPTNDYDEAHRLIRQAATLLLVEFSVLDSSIWRYMSQRGSGASRRCAAK